MDILNETVQTAPTSGNIGLDDLLTGNQPGGQLDGIGVESTTLSALQDLNLGGKTAEEAEAEQLALEEKLAEEEAQKRREEEAKEEALPRSHKDKELNSLVNFSNLSKAK